MMDNMKSLGWTKETQDADTISEEEIRYIQDVPRNMTVGEKF